MAFGVTPDQFDQEFRGYVMTSTPNPDGAACNWWTYQR